MEILNRQAHFKFFIEEKFTAGIVLTGSEVKSIRQGHVQLADAFVDFHQGEAFLTNAHISPYKDGGYANHEPERKRKILLNRHELDHLYEQTRKSGRTVVVTKIFFAKNWIKLEIGLAKGKKHHDQRESIKEREAQRDLQRALRRDKA